MANLDNPTALSLGRVGISAVDMRSTAPMLARQPTAVDGLMEIGKTIAGGLVKEQKRKEFYSGQDRILQASLEGTQKEELQNILEEQPYYMTLLGNGAAAEGAIEMASRVGAGKLFDSNMTRLETGEDASTSPDTYRQDIMSQVGAQRTGNPTVDSVIMPQLITKAQKLIGTQLGKHLEFNARNAQLHSVDSAVAVLDGLTRAVKTESNNPEATFLSGTPSEMLLPATKARYEEAVNDFNPSTRALNVDEEGWITTKLAVALPALEQGNTAVFQIINESGLYSRLSAADRAKVNASHLKGIKENDSHNQMGFISQEKALNKLVLEAKDDSDVSKVEAAVQAVRKDYIDKKITPPDYLQDDTAMKQYINRAQGNVDEYLRRQATLNERSAKVTAERISGLRDEDSLDAGIISNVLHGSPMGDVYITTADGTSGSIAPTKEDVTKAYNRKKAMLNQGGKEAKAKWLADNNLKSVEALAYSAGIVDQATQARLTSALRLTIGKSSDNKLTSKVDKNTIGVVLAEIDNLESSIPKDGIAEYIKDEKYRSILADYFDAKDVTGDVEAAWDASFGRDRTQPITFVAKDLDKAIKDNKDIEDSITAAGQDGLAVTGWIKSEAIRQMEDRTALSPEEGVKKALVKFKANTETVGKATVLGVPPQYRIGARLGIRDPSYASAVADTYIKSLLPEDFTYGMDFNPRTQRHVVIPRDNDGNYIGSSAFEVDYKAMKKLTTSTKALADAQFREIAATAKLADSLGTTPEKLKFKLGNTKRERNFFGIQ